MPKRIGTVGIAAALLLCVVATDRAAQSKPGDPSRPASVLVLDFSGDGHQLTSARDGVLFDIDGTGKPAQIGWTAKGSDDAFLFLDTNGNGRVDGGRELLGDGWRMPDGARSPSVDATLAIVQGFLPPYSNPLPPGISWLDAQDEVYGRLRVWQDINHDGVSEPSELTSLASRRIDRILLSFGRLRDVHDDFGNSHNFDGVFYIGEQRRTAIQRKMTDITFARK